MKFHTRELATSIVKDGETIGRLRAHLRGDEVVRRLIQGSASQEGDVVFAVDREGTLFAASEEEEEKIDLNAIGDADFTGWVQERGLYFAGEWDAAYRPLLSAADPGEPERRGGLIVAKYGEGHFCYTGLSFFRQLPAGVPGAYRLFVNLVELGGGGKAGAGK